jgi:hypothetical protein
MSKTIEQMLKIVRAAMSDMDTAANTETVIAAHQYCKGYAQSMHDAGQIDATEFGNLLREIAGHFEVGRARFPEWSFVNFE